MMIITPDNIKNNSAALQKQSSCKYFTEDKINYTHLLQ